MVQLLFFMVALLGSPAMASSASEHLQQMDGKANGSDTGFGSMRSRIWKAPRVTFGSEPGEKRLVNLGTVGHEGTKVLVLSGSDVGVSARMKGETGRKHVKQQGLWGQRTRMRTCQRGSEAYQSEWSKKMKSHHAEAAPKPDTQTSYGHLEIDLRRDLMLPSGVRYFARRSTHENEERSEYNCDDAVCTPAVMKMNHTRNVRGHH